MMKSKYLKKYTKNEIIVFTNKEEVKKAYKDRKKISFELGFKKFILELSL